jgi:glycosyltransferase involved in cell wall biosynthesis
MILASVILTNYNYEEFIADAIRSALNQLYPHLELIVVDDGSTDQSLTIIRQFDGIKVVHKKNAGQLAAFNSGLLECSGDIIFFLDADDLWDAHYVQRAIQIYTEIPEIDSIYFRHKTFGEVHDIPTTSLKESRIVGYSIFDTLATHAWIGAPTSCLSFKAEFLRQILPLESLEHNWKVRADDVLVFASSLLGGLKYYCDEPLVHYRTHERNGFHGKVQTRTENFRYELKKTSLIQHFKRFPDSTIPCLLYQESKVNILSGYKTAWDYLQTAKILDSMYGRIVFTVKVFGLQLRRAIRSKFNKVDEELLLHEIR